MKVIKPLKLGVLHRTFENDGACYFVPTFLLYFAFDSPSVPLQEIHLWKTLGEELGEGVPLDECMPKPSGEVLLTARAYPPGGDAPSCAVRLELGAVNKQLYVFGEREWRRGVPTDPRPFRELPLSWHTAFGGPTFAPNPHGKGCGTVLTERGKVQFMPNVEHPKRLVAAPGDRPEPASFGALELTWPQRRALAGTYDARWQKERSPGFPADFDATFFNVAQPDQRITEFFRGDETFVLENMHPSRARIESRLPGLSTRCFITRDASDGEEFREIAMRIDTVHLLPHRLRGVVVFRGVTTVSEDDASDVKQLVAACERPGESRPMKHYQAVLAERLDKKRAHLVALRDRDLMASRDPGVPVHEEETLGPIEQQLATEGLVTQNQRRRAEGELERLSAELRAHGVDPDAHVPAELPKPEAMPALDDLADYVDEQLRLAEAAREEANKAMELALADTRRSCEENGLDLDAILAEAEAKRGGPPKFSAKAEVEKLEAQLVLAKNAGVRLEHVEAELADGELMAKLERTEAQLKYAYRKFAHLFPAARRLTGEPATALRAEVMRAHAAGETLRDRDLTGADLSGLELSGADFRGAFLERANLTDTRLAGADLSDAVLARADLTRADLQLAKVRGTNFGDATLDGTLLGAVDLTGAVLARARLTRVDLRGATLERVDMLDVSLRDCDLRDVRAKELQLLGMADDEIDLRGSDFSGAEFHRCNFLKVRLDGARFTGSSLRESVLLGVIADGADFARADCTNLRVVMGSSFAGASFEGARLVKANFRDTNLRGANLTSAELSEADFSGADLTDASLTGAIGRRALFIKTNLTRCNVRGADLMEAVLQKAMIEDTDFRGANLFRVDFAKVRGKRGTRFDGANMKFIRFVDR
ncbi:MAG: DUF2169 domain-containing protein [Myxococcales bacterium]|nr:DUF2169 domain-containing protein [Myxococcales bacterium]